MKTRDIIFDWSRFLVAENKPLAISDEGFFEPERHQDDLISASEVISLPSQCSILFGDAGIGKTTILKTISKLIDEDVICQLVYAKSISSIEALTSSIETFISNAKDRNPVILLDGFDEGLLTKNNFGHTMEKPLELIKQRGAKIVISSRKQGWNTFIDEQCSEIFGKENYKSYSVTPLTKQDIKQSCENLSIDSSAFLKEIETNRLGYIAANPLTLKSLFLEFNTNNNLKGTDLYELHQRIILGMLSDEHNEYRDSIHQNDNSLSEPERLFELSARLAYLSIFTGKLQITSSEDKNKPEILNANLISTTRDEVAGYKKHLKALLNSPLFRQDGDIYTWSHTSYAEYLAAYYLTSKQFSTRKLLTLLLHNTPERKTDLIVPSYKEVAGWLCCKNKEFLSKIAEHNHIDLIQTRADFKDPSIRRELLSATLRGFHSWKIASEDLLSEDAAQYLWKLGHYKLYDIEQEVTPQKASSIEYIHICMAIARESLNPCYIEGALNDLTSFHNLDLRAQIQVCRYLCAVGTSQDILRLKPLLDTQYDEMVRGEILFRMWPEHLSYDELLRGIDGNMRMPISGNAKAHKYYNPYFAFLCFKFKAKPINDKRDSLEALKSLRKHLKRIDIVRAQPSFFYEKLMIGVLSPSFTYCGHSEVRYHTAKVLAHAMSIPDAKIFNNETLKNGINGLHEKVRRSLFQEFAISFGQLNGISAFHCAVFIRDFFDKNGDVEWLRQKITKHPQKHLKENHFLNYYSQYRAIF